MLLVECRFAAEYRLIEIWILAAYPKSSHFDSIVTMEESRHETIPSCQAAPWLIPRRLHQPRGKEIADEHSLIDLFSPSCDHFSRVF
ncbi:hypothetical protein PFISCL1PPCAC_24979 [Pristionchus fissidentatus]|uniref:Uncharacterized protein n=1 Tax=Pristionchus fissidentatus TaxID=1538716 RepID=A0AAV5WNU3_9BILA|nr:hypothetical protein PFISCL1PPCAC_24979 [Pristionchus fissidentatus]